MIYQYDYPRPMLTVDVLLLRFFEGHIEILLIQRKHSPFRGKWALPGGYMDINEPLENAARRELREETGLSGIPLFPLVTADQPGRDPRGRTITHLYGGICPPPFPRPDAGDDAGKVRWFPRQTLPSLAFDHSELMSRAWQRFKSLAWSQAFYLAFFSEFFSVRDSENLNLALFGRSEFSPILNNFARHCGLIQSSADNQFSRCLNNDELYQSDFDRLIEGWMEIIK